MCSTLLLPVNFYKLVFLPLTSVLSASSHSALAFGSPTQNVQCQCTLTKTHKQCLFATTQVEVNQVSGAIFLFRTISHRISPSRALKTLGSSSEACGCRSADFLALFSQDLKQHCLIVAAVRADLNRQFTNQFFIIHVK